MNRRVVALNAVIGGLSFLVLLQAYELFAGVRVDAGLKFTLAVVVAGMAGALSVVAVRWLPGNGSA